MYKYYCIVRPPVYAAKPCGFADYEIWLPGRYLDNGAGPWLGWITYPKRLTFEQIWRFDLSPADFREYAWYTLWQAADKSLVGAVHLYKEWRDLGRERLAERLRWGEGDRIAALVLSLMEEYK